MSEEQLLALEHAFNAFVEAYEERRSAAKAEGLLPKLLQCLEEANYTKRDIMFTLGLEALTVQRWSEEGKGMRPETYEAFKLFVRNILDAHPQRPINVSKTGFVSWRYIFEKRQAEWATRIWYISSGHFLLSNSRAFREVVRDLLIEANQPPSRTSPVIVYLYPRASVSEAHLHIWKKSLDVIKAGKPLRGSVIGISIDDISIFPHFLPGVRGAILERQHEKGQPDLEGYLRVRLFDETKESLLKALEPDEQSSHTPWLQVHPETAERWYLPCSEHFLDLVETKCKKQEEMGAKFQVHLLDDKGNTREL